MSGHDIIIADLRRQLDRMREERDEALSGEADAVRRAEAAELGCEIAYRREPTQAEGDAHEYAHHESMGPSHGTGECFVPMGGWTGRRCRVCRRWVWGGPTACGVCVAREERDEAVKQQRLAWERAAEKDRAYGDSLKERDEARAEADAHNVAATQYEKDIVDLRAELARLRARMPSDVVIDCIRGVVIYHNVSRGVTHEADVISAWLARQENENAD